MIKPGLEMTRWFNQVVKTQAMKLSRVKDQKKKVVFEFGKKKTKNKSKSNTTCCRGKGGNLVTVQVKTCWDGLSITNSRCEFISKANR